MLALALAGLGFLIAGPILGGVLLLLALALALVLWTPLRRWLGFDTSPKLTDVQVRERSREFSDELVRFLEDRADSLPQPEIDPVGYGDKVVEHTRTTMSRYEDRFSTRALALCDFAIERGWLEENRRFTFQHPTNPLGIREVAQLLGVIGHRE